MRLLGGEPRPIPAYNSNGLGLQEAPAVADEALELVAEGFRAVKIRLGRPAPADDVAAVRAVRSALPDDVALMADFNQALSSSAASRVCRRLDDEGLEWIEEPIRHDDYAGAARLRTQLRTPLQIGENFAGIHPMVAALAHGASDFVMPDLDRIGGVTGWTRAAALADASGVPMSSHLYPEVSAHLLAATPTAHWLEYVDWAAPLLTEPVQVTAGAIAASERPGAGLAWDEDPVAHHRIDSVAHAAVRAPGCRTEAARPYGSRTPGPGACRSGEPRGRVSARDGEAGWSWMRQRRDRGRDASA